MEAMIENIDYYLDEVGRMVFTESYLLKRGFCCENNCKHCPYKENQPETVNPEIHE